MKPTMIYTAVCGLMLSAALTSSANASLVATFTSGSNTATLSGALDSSGQNLQISSNVLPALGNIDIYGFSAASNSPSAPANGQEALEKAGTAVVINSGSSFQTLTINLSDNGFTPSPSSSLAILTGAASVTFSGEMSAGQPLNYYQYTSSANATSVSSNVVTLGSYSTENVAVGPVDFSVTNPYTLSSTLTLGLNPGDSATLTFQTDPTPAALPLPGTSAMLAMGLVGLGGIALLRKKRIV